MWSGIKAVYFGVPSQRVEEITGFDEGFKPNWFDEFKKRGIAVYGNIESEAGEEVLRGYVTAGKKSISRKGHKNSLGKKYLTFVYKLLSLFAK